MISDILSDCFSSTNTRLRNVYQEDTFKYSINVKAFNEYCYYTFFIWNNKLYHLCILCLGIMHEPRIFTLPWCLLQCIFFHVNCKVHCTTCTDIFLYRIEDQVWIWMSEVLGEMVIQEKVSLSPSWTTE